MKILQTFFSFALALSIFLIPFKINAQESCSVITTSNYMTCCKESAYRNLCTQDQIKQATATTTTNQNSGGGILSGATNSGGGILSGATNSSSNIKLDVKLKNPLKVDSIQDAVKAFMNAIIRIAIPFIVVFFIYSGFSFVTARGNPEAIKNAKNTFLYTIIGTLLILGAWAITNAIVGTINSIGS